MKKQVIGSAIVFMIILTAGFASAITTFTPAEINTAENDGFLYFYPQGVTPPGEVVTFYYSETPNLTASSFQLTLVQATPLSSPPVPDTVNGLDLFSGAIILPVGGGSPVVPVTFTISAIRDKAMVTHWTFKGTTASGALVSGEIWDVGLTKDRTKGTTPYPVERTFEISGFVTGNGADFNGAFHGKLYK
jgi:hypothetical protein